MVDGEEQSKKEYLQTKESSLSKSWYPYQMNVEKIKTKLWALKLVSSSSQKKQPNE